MEIHICIYTHTERERRTWRASEEDAFWEPGAEFACFVCVCVYVKDKRLGEREAERRGIWCVCICVCVCGWLGLDRRDGWVNDLWRVCVCVCVCVCVYVCV